MPFIIFVLSKNKVKTTLAADNAASVWEKLSMKNLLYAESQRNGSVRT